MSKLFAMHSVMVRTVGTFIGAVCSILVWEISRVNRVGLTLLMFFFGLPWWLIYLNGKFWKASGLFSLITTSISKYPYPSFIDTDWADVNLNSYWIRIQLSDERQKYFNVRSSLRGGCWMTL